LAALVVRLNFVDQLARHNAAHLNRILAEPERDFPPRVAGEVFCRDAAPLIQISFVYHGF
jgi:hypothetical protein